MREIAVVASAGISWKLCAMLLALISVSDLGRGQRDYLNIPDCKNTGNYAVNSTYSANLNATLAALSSNTTEYGFYSASVGQGQDRAYAIALCRGDRSVGQCRRCVENAVVELVRLCPDQKQASMWFEMCMLHYSDQPINGLQTNSGGYGQRNGTDVSNPEQFQQDRMALLDLVRGQAANGSSVLKVGAGISRNTSDSEILYVLLQCIPISSSEECDDCLVLVSQGLPPAARGGRRLLDSCNLRYEHYSFYNETRLRELNVQPLQIHNLSPGPVTTDDNTREKKDDSTTKIVIAIVVPVAVCIILASCAIFFLRRRKKPLPQIPETTEEINTADSLQHDFHVIRAATNDFADDYKLGEGGFGVVYRGKLSDGQEIAVKRLSRDSEQGDKEFKNEVLLVAKLQHKNLVRLLGFSLHRTERLLIYEYVPNASLDKFIFDSIKSSQLDWERRCKIIQGIARGLLYLHEDSRLRIIHRDLKASNILLDGNMIPKITDFGMAKLFEQDETQGNTKRIVGTYGYMSPEYALHGRFSVKSDVFSFGVLALEIISGRRNATRNGENVEYILSFVWQNWCERTAEIVIDPVLRDGRGSIHNMLRCIHIALLCVQEKVADRPTMNFVSVMLSSSTITLPVPSQPAFVMGNHLTLGLKDYYSKESGSNKESKIKAYTFDASSQNEMSVSAFHPR